MKNTAFFTVFLTMMMGIAGPAWGFSLGGSKFVIVGEYLYVAEIGLPPGCTVDERDLKGPKSARVPSTPHRSMFCS